MSDLQNILTNILNWLYKNYYPWVLFHCTETAQECNKKYDTSNYDHERW